MKLKVYIAGPYSSKDPREVEDNVRGAIDEANILFNYGFAPYVPHLNHYWNRVYKHIYDDWMALDMEFLHSCHALYRRPGESPGADKEVEEGQKWGIRVYTDLHELLKREATI
jgi:hypothetical protein